LPADRLRYMSCRYNGGRSKSRYPAFPLETLRDFTLVFVPLFVAMDPPGNLAFLVSMLSGVQPERHGHVVRIALVTGLIVGLSFLALGRAVFNVIGITDADFVVAGGLILLVVSLRELVSHRTEEVSLAPNELLAVVPIGTPLLVGPATISLLILFVGLYPLWMVLAAFVANILIAGILFSQSRRIVRFLGKGGLEAFAKVMYLLLAAIAVQLIRHGVTDIIQAL
jgi:multiple antibiotic resistance protein